MNIIVTGASRGIGAEAVKLLVEGGHRVLAVSRNADRLEALRNGNENIYTLATDITSAEVRSTLDAKLDEIGFEQVDALINNAGALINKPFVELTSEDFRYMYQVNVFAVFEVTSAVIPRMKSAGGSHIVNISSMGGVQGSAKFPGLSAYSSSKAAVAGLTECLAEELKEEGVKVNCLALGAAQTEMLEEAFPGYQAPLSAKEMAEYVVDFTLNAHRYLNGKIISVALSTP